MRTIWVCNVSGGPFQYTPTRPGKTPLGREEAHRGLKISPAAFGEVAAELERTLDFFEVPKQSNSKFWQRSPFTRTKSLLATLRTPSPVEVADCFEALYPRQIGVTYSGNVVCSAG